MAALGYTYSNAFLTSILTKATFTPPAAVYVALLTSAPTDAGGGTEASYTGYARVEAHSDWGTAASGSITNNAAVTFGACTGGSATVTYFAIYDASTGGNLITWGATTSSLAISNGITPSFGVGQLTVSDL